MKNDQKLFNFQDVVLLADPFDAEKDRHTPLHERRDLEMTEESTFEHLRKAIKELGLTLYLYSSPEELAKNANKHGKDIILSIYGGQASRNRMALVPAVCETFGLRFIGPDAYGRIIAQDKEISKRLAYEAGLATPNWRLIRNPGAIQYARALRPPFVVKPLLEGSSIGISQRNKVESWAEAKSLVAELLECFEQPVLIEEFIPGREVAYCSIESKAGNAWAYSEIIIEGQPGFFVPKLFDAEEKEKPTLGRTVRNIDSELSSQEKEALDTFLTSFGQYGYCRVDGRLSGGVFYFLELTPDAWIAPSGQFAKGFTEKGWKYSDVIAAVLSSAG